MIEKQVKIKVLTINNHSLLSFNKGKTFSHLQHKLFKISHKTVFKTSFAIHAFKTCKFQEVRDF